MSSETLDTVVREVDKFEILESADLLYGELEEMVVGEVKGTEALHGRKRSVEGFEVVMAQLHVVHQITLSKLIIS